MPILSIKSQGKMGTFQQKSGKNLTIFEYESCGQNTRKKDKKFISNQKSACDLSHRVTLFYAGMPL